MCCDDKFLFFMGVKTGSLIFAWIGAVLSGLGTLGCIVTNMVVTILLMSGGINIPYGVNIYILCSTLLMYFATGFIATVLLLVGIIQTKPILIKGYIIYGMAITVLYIITIIVFEAVTYVYVVARIAEIFAFFIYCSILYLHYLTYKGAVNTSNTNGYVASAPIEAARTKPNLYEELVQIPGLKA